MDTFDCELEKDGKILLENENQLLLIESQSGSLFSQNSKAAGLCVGEIQNGPVKRQIEALSELRALISSAEVTLNLQTANMLDDEQKTVARLNICTFTKKKKSAVLLICNPLRGYQPEFTKLNAAISAFTETNEGTLLQMLGFKKSHYDPKPDISLDPAAPIYHSANTIISTFIQVARQNEKGIIADIDTEFLHDYRVSLRKVRSVISLFKGVYDLEETKRLKQDFGDLMQITGRLRDLDVYLLDRDYYYSLVPETTHHGLDIMFEAFSEERAQLHKNISRSLKSKSYDNRINLLLSECSDNRWLQGKSWQQPSLDFGCRAILKRYNKVCRIARTIDETTPDETVHELRIHCKKLRYLMEFFTPLYDRKNIKKLIKSLKILQDNLGRFNDYSVQQISLAEFLQNRPAKTNDAVQVAESIGGLIAMLSHLQRKEKEQVMANFDRFDSEETRALFHDLFTTGK